MGLFINHPRHLPVGIKRLCLLEVIGLLQVYSLCGAGLQLTSSNMYMVEVNLGHHGGSVKLVPTMLTNLVSLEQFHRTPMGMYDGGLLKLVLGDQ